MALMNPKPYEYDYDGACAPGSAHWHGETFSVGVFQWIPKSRGKGLKRGKVIKRFKGFFSEPKKVYDAAEAFIKTLSSPTSE